MLYSVPREMVVKMVREVIALVIGLIIMGAVKKATGSS